MSPTTDRRVMRLTLARAKPADPEDDIAIRVVVLATVLVAMAAVVAQGAVGVGTTALVFLLLPVGYAFSHARRTERNIAVKIVLAIAMLAALGAFLNSVRYATSVDDARAGLASLFLWIQVIHGFDLPRRRDLSFSLAASTAMMAEAGSLSLSSSYLLFLTPYAALAGLWLFMSSRPSRGDGRVRVVRRSSQRRRPIRLIAIVASAGLVLATAVFMAVPHLQGVQVIAPPFSLAQRVSVPGFNGSVVNPGLGPPSRPGMPPPFSPDAYGGFGTSLDLRVRGALSNRLVMTVRSPQPAFWRAQAYDTFDGTTWTASDTQTQTVGGAAPISIPNFDAVAGQRFGWAETRQLVQTFYIQSSQPNAVFAAYSPSQIYLPASSVQVDHYDSVRSPILLEDGMVYSVVSSVPVTSPALLRRSRPRWPATFLQQYTQLPTDLPPRVVALAHRITDAQPTIYDKVMAVQGWLKTHTQYNLTPAPDPPGVDAVGWFLLHRRQGTCEHFSSAMIVLLRAVGIPARMAVGFDPGHYNPLTGYYEVRESDAHSWVEVQYPGVGWVQYDPTHVVPVANPGFGSHFIAPQVIAAIGRFLSRVTPAPLKVAAHEAGTLAVAGARGLAREWPVAIAVALLAVAGAVGLRRRSKRLQRGPPPVGSAAAFAALCDTFAARGLEHRPNHTPGEHLRRLLREDDIARASRDDVTTIVRTFERDRYSSEKPAPEEIYASLAAAARVRESVREPAHAR